jgi:hypothetical protein
LARRDRPAHARERRRGVRIRPAHEGRPRPRRVGAARRVAGRRAIRAGPCVSASSHLRRAARSCKAASES